MARIILWGVCLKPLHQLIFLPYILHAKLFFLSMPFPMPFSLCFVSFRFAISVRRSHLFSGFYTVAAFVFLFGIFAHCSLYIERFSIHMIRCWTQCRQLHNPNFCCCKQFIADSLLSAVFFCVLSCASPLRIVCMTTKFMAEICILRKERKNGKNHAAPYIHVLHFENCRFCAIWSQNESS